MNGANEGQDEVNPLSAADRALFHAAAKGTRRLRTPRTAPPPRTSVRPQQRHPRPAQEATDAGWSTQHEDLGISALSTLSHRAPGVPQRVLQSMARGNFVPQQRLDLHGDNLETAAQRVPEAITQALANRRRRLLVVHGKGHRSSGGYPLLKTWLATQLPRDTRVLAFRSAAEKDGGTGALYLLLRRPERG
ncbi:MAG: Smr/MutS family protein [Pseudomonadota bacterium]|nr:Smr/MutS family protein [Pseudomonadota bacterium]